MYRSIISYHSSSTQYRYPHRPTPATTTHLDSSLTAAPSYARDTATAPTRGREMPGTATTAGPRTTSSSPARNRRSPTRSTAAAVAAVAVGKTAVVRGRLATACRRRLRPYYEAAVAATEAAACWPTAPTPWRGRTPEDRYPRPATPQRC